MNARLLICTGLLLSSSSLFAQNSLPVDAVSSASKVVKITGGTAFETSVELLTWHKYSYGMYVIEWGTSTSYGNNITIESFPNTQTKTITDLSPNTEYFFRFTATDGNEHDPSSLDGSFMTAATTAVLPFTADTHAAQSQFSLRGQHLTVNLVNESNDILRLVAPDGRMLAQSNNARAGLTVPADAHGIAIAMILRGSTIIAKEKISLGIE